MTASYGGDEITSLVIDVGSAWTKVGYSGEDSPVGHFPSTMWQNQQKDSWVVGQDEFSAINLSGCLRNPLKGGIVSDWESYSKIWDHAFSKHLLIELEEHPVLAIEPAFNPREIRRQMLEFVFEKYKVPGFFLVKSPVSSAFATGRSTALVIECGAACTVVSVVYEGYVLQKSVTKQDLAGFTLSRMTGKKYGLHHGVPIHLPQLISQKCSVPIGSMCKVTLRQDQINPQCSQYLRSKIMDDLKETSLSVAPTPLDPNAPFDSSSGIYEFPCGYSATINDPYSIPESLFQPLAFLGPEELSRFQNQHGCSPNGLSQLIHSCLSATEAEIRPLVLDNIIVTGGCSQFPGFIERLAFELQNLYPGTLVKIHSAISLPEKKFGAWLGGSILGSLSSFQQLWISKKEYEEAGKHIVDVKCV